MSHDIKKNNGNSDCLYLDSTDKDSFIECYSYIKKKYKKIDILINGAGVNAPTDFFKITEININSPINFTILRFDK